MAASRLGPGRGIRWLRSWSPPKRGCYPIDACLHSHAATLLDRVGPNTQPRRRFEGDVAALFADIESRGHERVWLCGGGVVAGEALAIGRIDEVIVTVAPTAVGAGRALFQAPRLPHRRFELMEVTRIAGNAARLRWLAVREAPTG